MLFTLNLSVRETKGVYVETYDSKKICVAIYANLSSASGVEEVDQSSSDRQ